jgi:hypothetical protein
MNQVRGQPFEPGNKMGRGRPKGSRNKRGAEAQTILAVYSEAITKKCVAKALEGNFPALKLCMDLLRSSLRERGVRIRLPKRAQIKDIELASQRVVDWVTNGNLTLSEGEKLLAILGTHRENIERRELETRITELEKIAEQQNPGAPRRRNS